MKIWFDKRLKNPTYYGQVGYREGKKVYSVNEKNFGRRSELLKITDDPEAYVREQIALYNSEHNVDRTSNKRETVPKTDTAISHNLSLNIGYFVFQFFINKLSLDDFFSVASAGRRFHFDPYTTLRFMVYSRILEPASKLQTCAQFEHYLEKPDIEYKPMLKFMDFLYEQLTPYIEWLYKKSSNIVKRDTAIIYYDTTNFYMESKTVDEDYTDEVTGEVVHGLRRYGISKDHHNSPIVSMGLVVDRNGIPITMCVYPGNKQEVTTVLPLEQEVTKMIDTSRFIYCADAGLGSYGIRHFNSLGGRAFVVTQSVKKLNKPLKTAVFNDCDYHRLSNNEPVSLTLTQTFDKFDPKYRDLYDDRIYKVINADISETCNLYTDMAIDEETKKQLSKGKLPQNIIVTYSRKLMEAQRYNRQHQIDQAKKLLETSDPETIQKSPNDARRFIKAIKTDSNGEKIISNYELDTKKIEREEKYDGFFAIATNLEGDVHDILGVSRQRYIIEDRFRMMKHNLDGRPVWHFKRERIVAHLAICYTALLVECLLERKLDETDHHSTTDKIIATLRNMMVIKERPNYHSLYDEGELLPNLMEITGLKLNYLEYSPKDINSMLRKIV